MKRKFLVILMCVVLAMTGCGNDTSDNRDGISNVENDVMQDEKNENEDIGITMEVLENAEVTPIEEIDYLEVDGVVYIEGYLGESPIVVIPDEINGCPVVEIIRTAFRNNEVIKAVKIGDNVKIIKDEAFINCKNLEYVIFGQNVETVEKNTFVGCGKVKEIRLNEGLTTIGQLVFPDTIEPLVIPKTVISIGDGAFGMPVQVYAGSYAEEFMKVYATYYNGYTYEVIE